MVNVKNSYGINTSIPIIVENYKVLHFDEFPILFAGTNKFGNKLIGSFSYEDEENDFFRYFVILVEDAEFFNFFQNKVSYLDLMMSSQEAFIVDKDINDNVLSAFPFSVASIPQDYLPSKDSFIPRSFETSQSLSFSFSLKGKLADLHKSLVNEVNGANQTMNDFLEEGLNVLRGLSLRTKVYSQPSTVGSYRLNFDIEFEQGSQISLFPIDQDLVGEFLNNYFRYIAVTLPSEPDNVLETTPNSRQFEELTDGLKGIYKSVLIEPSQALTFALIDDINKSAVKLAEVTDLLKTSESFNAIEFGKIDSSGVFAPTGLLKENYKESVLTKLIVSDEDLLIDETITSDESAKAYRILVYDLNLHSGKGGASLYYDGENFQKVRLYISKGDKELSNSVFTKSMDENKVIDVRGIATKKGGRFKKLECYL